MNSAEGNWALTQIALLAQSIESVRRRVCSKLYPIRSIILFTNFSDCLRNSVWTSAPVGFKKLPYRKMKEVLVRVIGSSIVMER